MFLSAFSLEKLEEESKLLKTEASHEESNMPQRLTQRYTHIDWIYGFKVKVVVLTLKICRLDVTFSGYIEHVNIAFGVALILSRKKTKRKNCYVQRLFGTPEAGLPHSCTVVV